MRIVKEDHDALRGEEPGGHGMEELTRRMFMKKGAVMVGGVLGAPALVGLGARSGAARAAAPAFPETRFSVSDAAKPRVLVAYGSMHGSTGGVAEAVSRTLCDAGMRSEVRRVETLNRVSDYDAVVVGSAVRRARWLPEAVDFVQSFRDVLAERPVAYFLTCLALYQDTPESRRTAAGYMTPVLEAVPKVVPRGVGLFAGVLDYPQYNFVMRMVMKRKMEKLGVPEGDHRNWTRIRAWAEILIPVIGGEGAPVAAVSR